LRKGMGKKIKSILEDLKPKFFMVVNIMVMTLIKLKRYGQTGKLLPHMHLINRIQHVMHLLLIKRHILRLTILAN